MNLINGRLLGNDEALKCIDTMYERMAQVRQNGRLTAQEVISACGALSDALGESHVEMLIARGMDAARAARETAEAKLMLSGEYLRRRIETELGEGEREFVPYGGSRRVRVEQRPLGVLMHIAAGNVDALPAFSVLEGLLTGNINILKLPGGEDGLSVLLLKELTDRLPKLADYIYVFDTPSDDMPTIKRLAMLADAVVVWGGDGAVTAARRMLPPEIKLIEWGHKLSFAYVSGDVRDEQLYGIACNICDTDQLLCSSCQGIYLDTDSFDEAADFARRFLGVLEECVRRSGVKRDEFFRAKRTLELYTERIEECFTVKKVFAGDGCSVTAYEDAALVPSLMFCGCWVKPLPRRRLTAELCRYKNRLQTAALVCDEKDRPQLEELLANTGVVRITSGENMSKSFCGAAHDGEYALRRYTKWVSYEY